MFIVYFIFEFRSYSCRTNLPNVNCNGKAIVHANGDVRITRAHDRNHVPNELDQQIYELKHNFFKGVTKTFIPPEEIYARLQIQYVFTEK